MQLQYHSAINFFQYRVTQYTNTTGLNMDTTISSVFIEIISKNAERNSILQILNNHKVAGYFRHADDIWSIYDKKYHVDKESLKRVFNKNTLHCISRKRKTLRIS
jgi:hypothetical protein